MGTKVLEHALGVSPADMAQSRWPLVAVAVGGTLFIAALIGSATVVPVLRPLHLFQALIYVAVIYFARRNSAAAFGAGVTIAVIWNAMELFITHNAQGGLVAFLSFLHSGVARRIDTMFVSLGTLGHFILIIGCLAAFLRQHEKRSWARFGLGGVLVVAYFAVIVATLLPR